MNIHAVVEQVAFSVRCAPSHPLIWFLGNSPPDENFLYNADFPIVDRAFIPSARHNVLIWERGCS